MSVDILLVHVQSCHLSCLCKMKTQIMQNHVHGRLVDNFFLSWFNLQGWEVHVVSMYVSMLDKVIVVCHAS